MNRISTYVFIEILKGFSLVFFIFLSIAWLLQFTRLISLTQLLQVEIISILYLSFFLIPNLITVIMPFVITFSLIITFMKLDKDRELISIYSLGLNINSITKPLINFSILIFSILIFFNFYLAPNIYKDYKLKEYEIRNNVNFEKIIISNFIELNKNTFLDFKKVNQKFEEVFIKYNENSDNMIFAKEADIYQDKDKFLFKLNNGFKITLLNENKIEKLEFDNYTLEINNNSYEEYDNFDNNTFDVFEDIKNKNYINIFYKILDSLIVIFIINFFYIYNLKKYKLNISNLLSFIFISSALLIFNQIIKNSNLNLGSYITLIIFLLGFLLIYLLISKIDVKN